MSTLNVFTITNTAGTPISAIQPYTLDGPGGVQQSSDLYMYGIGFPTWGQGADQNDYRLTENYACPDMTGFPSSPRYSGLSVLGTLSITPASAVELGAGNGINVPLIGQTWFNTTAQKLLVYKATGWAAADQAVTLSPTAPTSPTNGDIWYNTTTGYTYVYDGNWISVAQKYLPLSGGVMLGNINMNGNQVIGANIIGGVVAGAQFRSADFGTTNQISVPTGGASPYVGTNPTNVIYTPANLPATASPFVYGMIMMWTSATPPARWAICDGTLGTPDLRGNFVIAAGAGYTYGSRGGSQAGSLSIVAAGTHQHTGLTGATTLTATQMPAHTHAVYLNRGTHPGGGSGGHWFDVTGGLVGYSNTFPEGNATGTQILQSTGGNASHTHTISTDGLHTHTGTVSTIPPYYCLYYIMYTG